MVSKVYLGLLVHLVTRVHLEMMALTERTVKLVQEDNRVMMEM